MHITVAICTWNRERLLDWTLRQFQHLRIPDGTTWELVVVDNNCTDGTPQVIARHARTLPVRCVRETQQGHSHARNRALDEARGELILWTDDDVFVSDNWLAEYVRVAGEYPEAGYFGGRVTPWYADDVPVETACEIDANMELLAPVYSIKDYGDAVRPFGRNEGPFGANMGFRTELLKQYRFNPQFGRVKTGLIGADEVSVIRAMQAANVPGVWIGTTEVGHYIPKERTTHEHFWRYFVGLGQTQVRLDGLPSCSTLFGYPRWALFGSLKLRVTAAGKRWCGRKSWLEDYLHAAKLHGYLIEARRR